jgi:hypothetical protein
MVVAKPDDRHRPAERADHEGLEAEHDGGVVAVGQLEELVLGQHPDRDVEGLAEAPRVGRPDGRAL